MEAPVKRKVVKVSGYSSSRPPSRPASPSKGYITSQSSLTPPPSTFRPKAKVNSSATVARKPSSSSSIASTSRITVSAASTPRSPSPFKPTRNNVGLTPTSGVKARVTLHPPSNTTASTPSSPESRQRSLTAVSSNAPRSDQDRRRSSSFSLHNKYSSSSLSSTHTPPMSPVKSSPSLPSANGLQSQAGLRPIKVKSKISGLAKYSAVNTGAISPTPSISSPRLTHSRSHITSVSASHILTTKPPSPVSPEEQFYPITTAVRAASPYRFATTRNGPPNNQHHYRPFLPNDDQFINYSRPTSAATADTTTVTLPPQSPPTSALSFSSHSSVSYNTETSAESLGNFSALGSRARPLPQAHRRRSSVLSAFDDHASGMIPMVEVPSGQEMDGETDGDSAGSAHKVKAEAKSNRKIADLEITNRSLLAINSSLETTKHRQAKEIRELRRKLRESRLILPPRAFQALKSKLDHDDTASENDDDENDEPPEGTEDEVYKRVRVIIDGLIETGKRALESKPEDFLEGGKGGTKVLHAEEVRTWRRDSGDVAMPDGDISSEGEVEAMTSFISDSAPPGLPPPITVTPSP